MINVTDGIGPHEGIEIELLLAGQKNIAYFEVLPEDALTHIYSGELAYKKHHLPVTKDGQIFAIPAHFVYRHGHEEELYELITLMVNAGQLSKKFDAKTERRIGQILGYSEKSIDMYIEHAKSITRVIKRLIKN